jgi:hypothetical protein
MVAAAATALFLAKDLINALLVISMCYSFYESAFYENPAKCPLLCTGKNAVKIWFLLIMTRLVDGIL